MGFWDAITQPEVDITITVNGRETEIVTCGNCHVMLTQVDWEDHIKWHKQLAEAIRRAAHNEPNPPH